MVSSDHDYYFSHLPNCRKNHPILKPGQWHAPKCENYSSRETVEIIGGYVYQTGDFILQDFEEMVTNI